MADEITVREACYQVSRPLISQKAPYIVSSFDAIPFDVVYEQAQGADEVLSNVVDEGSGSLRP